MRPGSADEGWKQDERAAFLDRLRATEARTLLEVGGGNGPDGDVSAATGPDGEVAAATGPDGAWFAAEGLAVTPVAGDVLRLDLPESSFDAAYSLDALPLPTADLDHALRAVRTALAPGGLFFLGVLNGPEEQMLRYAQQQFDILDFHVVELADGARFQALTLVRP